MRHRHRHRHGDGSWENGNHFWDGSCDLSEVLSDIVSEDRNLEERSEMCMRVIYVANQH